jgi:hypothetical protein
LQADMLEFAARNRTGLAAPARASAAPRAQRREIR